MKVRLLYPFLLLAILIVEACSPKATPVPTVNAVGTIAAQMASVMLTQTVAAYSPTPSATAIPTATETPIPTKDKSNNIITVVNLTGCYFGPGPSYGLQSYIHVPKKVELLGIGNTNGWYIINGPYYYRPCWVAAADVQISPDMDLTRFPVMTPGH